MWWAYCCYECGGHIVVMSVVRHIVVMSVVSILLL